MASRNVRRGETDGGPISLETAEAYREAGRLDDALPLLEQTLAYYVRNFGAHDPDPSTARTYLAAAYQQSDRLRDAIPLFVTALTDTERMLGSGQPPPLVTP